jgi:metal-responsive CopG/Arc/MetJ family transcriptional regulator
MRTTTTMRRVMFTIPPALLKSVEALAAKLRVSRSNLVRSALESYIAEVERQELCELLKEGYQVHAERDLAICKEFAYADYEATMKHVPPYEEATP